MDFEIIKPICENRWVLFEKLYLLQLPLVAMLEKLLAGVSVSFTQSPLPLSTLVKSSS